MAFRRARQLRLSAPDGRVPRRQTTVVPWGWRGRRGKPSSPDGDGSMTSGSTDPQAVRRLLRFWGYGEVDDFLDFDGLLGDQARLEFEPLRQIL